MFRLWLHFESLPHPQHRAITDYELPLRRYMERATLCGTAPY